MRIDRKFIARCLTMATISSMDALADALSVSGVRGVLGARIEAGDDWGWWASPSPGAAIHAVTAGTAWVGIPGDAPRQLLPGDVLLLPRGADHALGSDPGALARTTADRHDDYRELSPGTVSIGTGPVRTHILCAHYEHDVAMATPVLTLLPDLVLVRAGVAGTHLEDCVRLLARELADPQPATTTVLRSLVDVLLVGVLRAWLADGPAPLRPSWLGALEDPIAGAAIALMHGHPERPWTTAMLARELAVSRATLARRFPVAVGQTPGAHLTRWRMDLAAQRLRTTDQPLEAIAQAVGYTSVYAFSRAFRRVRGTPPGRYRTSVRAAVAA